MSLKGERVLGDFEIGEGHEGKGGDGLASLHRPASALNLRLAPDAGEGGLYLLFEAGDQFAIGGHQRLLGFDLGHDGLLRG
jgi:hypothetical protein